MGNKETARKSVYNTRTISTKLTILVLHNTPYEKDHNQFIVRETLQRGWYPPPQKKNHINSGSKAIWSANDKTCICDKITGHVKCASQAWTVTMRAHKYKACEEGYEMLSFLINEMIRLYRSFAYVNWST